MLNPTVGPQRAVLSLASTQIKKSRQLIALLDNVLIPARSGGKIRPPTFANIVLLTTVAESNEKGDWKGAKMEVEALVDDPKLYAAGKAFHALVQAGRAAINYEAASAAAMGEGSDEEPPREATVVRRGGGSASGKRF